jgi:hypothetical protein
VTRPAGAVLPLDAQLARCVARRATLARYHHVKAAGDRWRQSDDNTVATVATHPNHRLYAKPGKAAEANKALKKRGSGIELAETSATRDFYTGKGKPRVRMHQIEAINTVNGSRGASMKLWADCGRSAAVVVGSSKRRAVFERDGVKRHTTINDPVKMKIIIMKGWLSRELERRRKLNPIDPELVEIKKALRAGRKLEARARALAAKMATTKSTTKEYKKLDDERDEAIEDAAEAYFEYYNALGAAERDAIDRSLKINRYATPEVGEGWTISTGGNAIAGQENDTWNFHWAGVVLASDDGKDKVVLENYSVGKWSRENDQWTFEMYGTEKASQSFHERHFDSDLHGETPTSMTIRGSK